MYSSNIDLIVLVIASELRTGLTGATGGCMLGGAERMCEPSRDGGPPIGLLLGSMSSSCDMLRLSLLLSLLMDEDLLELVKNWLLSLSCCSSSAAN